MKNMGINKFTIIGLGLAAMLMVSGCGRGEGDGADGAGKDPSQRTLDSNDGPVAERDTRTVDLGDGVSMELVWVEAGSFLMGSASGGYDDERPVREVRIKRGYLGGRRR